MISLSVLLLIAAFRSLYIPLASAVFNLLSVGAAYGVVVAVFQEGVGASLIAVDTACRSCRSCSSRSSSG